MKQLSDEEYKEWRSTKITVEEQKALESKGMYAGYRY